jgi:hypothetical protein
MAAKVARRKRARKHIAIAEKLASALADRLPQHERDALRASRVSAQSVIRMFTPDHNVLHTHGGSDKWFNLTMRRRGPDLKAKDNRDTSIAAKAIRVSDKHEDFRRRVLAPVKRPRENRSRFPQGRKLQSRGFQRSCS